MEAQSTTYTERRAMATEVTTAVEEAFQTYTASITTEFPRYQDFAKIIGSKASEFERKYPGYNIWGAVFVEFSRLAADWVEKTLPKDE